MTGSLGLGLKAKISGLGLGSYGFKLGPTVDTCGLGPKILLIIVPSLLPLCQ